MSKQHHIAVQQRVAAYTMFCNHISKPIIAKTLNVAPSTIHRWEGEDGWQERRAALLQSEVVPAWASEIRSMLLLQHKRLLRMEAQLAALGSPPPADFPDSLATEKTTLAEVAALTNMSPPP